jgi:hypothetical protein
MIFSLVEHRMMPFFHAVDVGAVEDGAVHFDAVVGQHFRFGFRGEGLLAGLFGQLLARGEIGLQHVAMRIVRRIDRRRPAILMRRAGGEEGEGEEGEEFSRAHREVLSARRRSVHKASFRRGFWAF